ncbi:MAG TPA: hypothetical protein VFD04_26175 [Actinomycetes bacterium]|nr:hypothetical protein [Actinomycetes bacterium]
MRPVRIVSTFVFAATLAITGCTAHSAGHLGATPTPPSSSPPPPTTADHHGAPPNPPVATLPLGHVQQLDAVQAVGDGGTVWAVGKGAILKTSDGGRSWARVWRGAQELREVDFVSASAGWALGDHLLLGTVDGGRHWRVLGQPGVGPLRQVHFASPSQGWGVAATRLVHSSDGGRTWQSLPAPARPQTVCFTAPDDGWLASGRQVWRSVDGGRGWRRRFTLPLPPDGLPADAELQCAAPGAAWVRFDAGDAAAGHIPYALYATGDGGAHWRGVLAEGGTLAGELHLPPGPGSYPGPFSVIDPRRAVLLSATPAAERTGAVRIGQGGRLRRLPDIPDATLSTIWPMSVSFASTTRGWVVGSDRARGAVILATTDGGRSWQTQLRA